MSAASAATLLQLMRLASPSLPVGGFSYSDGLEAAIDASHVATQAQVLDWLRDQLHLGLARGELPVVARALAAWQRHDQAALIALNAWFGTTRETSELRLQAEQMGRSLAQWLRNRAADDPRLALLEALQPAPLWPVAFALGAAQADATPQQALLAYAAGWAENGVQAAMKAVPLGQRAGQSILDALALDIPAAVDTALGLEPGDMLAFTPMLAILSSQHETQYSRLFRS